MAGPVVHTLHLANDLSEVGRANDAFHALWESSNLPGELEGRVSLCLEEVLSNVIRHGCEAGKRYDIQVRWTILDEGIEVEVSDDARPFDPLSLPPPDINAPLEQRRAGGLGVFLVRKTMDEVHYEHRDGRNRFMFRKRWTGG
jgi:serine/threonine-protein kinase RsbW